MNIKYLYTGLLSLALLGTACNDKSDYQPIYDEQDSQVERLSVYFYPANTTSYNLGETDKSITVEVYRSNADTAESYALKCEDATDASLFNVPSSVSFAKDELVTTFDVTFDASKMIGLEPYNLTFVVGEGVNTPYAYQKVSYTLTYFPWNDVVSTAGDEYGTWYEDFLTTIYNLPEDYRNWPVKIQASPAVKGLYRIVNPYEQSLFGPYDDDDMHYMYINASNPNNVFICDQTGNPMDGSSPVMFNIGINFGGTVGYITILPLFNDAYADDDIESAYAYSGTLVDGVLTFPAKSFVMSGTGSIFGGGWYYCNNDGGFKILWPGAVDADDVWEPIGKGQYTDVLISPMTNDNGSSATWEVEVEQYKKDPALYRMVNPYKVGVMENGWNYDGDKYFEFDATNPECVKVKEQEIFYMDIPVIGGSINALNLAYNFSFSYDDETIINNGYNDTFVDNVFSFGSMHLRLYLPDTNEEEYINQLVVFSDEAGKLVLEGEASATAAANRSEIMSKNPASRYLVPVAICSFAGKYKIFPASKRMVL